MPFILQTSREIVKKKKISERRNRGSGGKLLKCGATICLPGTRLKSSAIIWAKSRTSLYFCLRGCILVNKRVIKVKSKGPILATAVPSSSYRLKKEKRRVVPSRKVHTLNSQFVKPRRERHAAPAKNSFGREIIYSLYPWVALN